VGSTTFVPVEVPVAVGYNRFNRKQREG
jgi:hypothetical protein